MLIFYSVSDFLFMQRSYLDSKNEMIDRDLAYIESSIGSSKISDWLMDYVKENRENIIRPLTEEDHDELLTDKVIEEVIYYLVEKDGSDPAEKDEPVQFSIARQIVRKIAESFTSSTHELHYDSIYLMEITGNDEAYIYVRSNYDSDYVYDFYNLMEDIDCGITIEYAFSEHSAAEKIAKNGLEPGNILHEVFRDRAQGKDYYIGYLPITVTGTKQCLLCIRYDWTEFYSQLMSKVMVSMLVGAAVLLSLNGLLMFIIYIKALSPLSKVTSGVKEYMNDKDSKTVNEKMSAITARNEVGVLAESFSEMATEILTRVNKQVCSNNKAKMFVTVWLGILEISTGKLITSSAGHEYPMLNLDGRYEILKDKHGPPVGTFKKAKYT